MFRFLRSRVVLLGAVVVIGGGAALWAVRGWLLHHVLPDILEKQLTQALNRETSFGDIGLGFIPNGYFCVKDLKIAKGKLLKDGTMVAAKQLVIRFKFVRFIFHPKDPAGAVRRIELEDPYINLDVAGLAENGGGKKRRKKDEQPAFAPPKTYLSLRGGTLVLTRRGREFMQLTRVKGDLDLREYPRVEGSLKFAVPPDSTVAMNGYVHFALKSFGWALSIDSLDLSKISDLVSAAAPGTPVKVAGRLTAELDIRGGFMTPAEILREMSGTGSLKLDDGAVFLRGAPVMTEAFVRGNMEDRAITLESLSARMLDGALTASGRLNDFGLGSVRLKGRLENVPLASLRALSPRFPASVEGVTSLEFSMTGTGFNPVVTAKLTAPVAGIAGIRLENLSAQAAASRSGVRLSSLKARFWDGTVEGSAEAWGWNEGKMALKADLTGAGLNVAKSPLGGRYEGQGALTVKAEGPLDRLRGEVKLNVTKFKARGISNSDLTVHAVMDGNNIRVDAVNASKSASVRGLLVLGGPAGPRCEGCELDLQDRLTQLLALGGVEPPKGLAGRGSATIRVDGPLSKPVITAEAFVSGLKLGKMAIGDQVRLPRLVFKDSTLSIPASAPLELVWVSEGTRARAWGKVPVATFTGKGDQNVAFHLECLRADAAILKRLNLLKQAKGGFDLAADIAGTSAFPVFWSLTLDGSGKLLTTNGTVFAKDIEKWRIKARISDGEGVLEAAEFQVDKQKFGLIREANRSNRFVLTGRSLSALDVGIETDWKKGLPVVVPDVAELRVKLRVRAIKDSQSDELWITGPDPSKGAEIEVSNGVIMYAGGGGMKAKKPKKGEAESAEPEKPSAFSEWAKRSLCVLGTVTFGKNVRYRPPSLAAKFATGAVDAVTGNVDALNKMAGSGLGGAMRSTLLDFDVVIKDGSAIKVKKERETRTAGGKMALEPGGKLILWAGITTYEFTLVNDLGVKHEVEFLPGDELAANVSATGEIVMRNKPINTGEGNQVATVDEIGIRINLRPPDEVRDTDVKRALEASHQFLRYTMNLSSNPEVVSGVVTVTDVQAAQAGQPANVVAAPAQPVTFRPDQKALLLALSPDLAGFTKPGGGSQIFGDFMKTTGIWVIFDTLIARPIKAILNLDVLKFQKSETMAASSAATTGVAASGGGSAGTAGGGGTGTASASSPSSSQQFMADVLKNSEVTIGKSLPWNFYTNWHVIMLDTTWLTGARNSTAIGAEAPSKTGVIGELEYHTLQYKATGRWRFFSLPDDPYLDKKYEGYVGVEMNQMFAGVGQRERFIW